MKLQTEVPGYELIEVGTDPFTYRLNNTETGEFITAVRNCSFSEKTSVESTTRQLLVGLERLHISRQDSVEINGERFLRSHIDAQLEGRPVKMATYSYRLGRCVSDLVIWSETRSQHQQETDRIASHFSLLLTE